MVPQAPQLRYKHKYSPNQHCMLSDPSPFLCSDSHCIFIYHFSTHIPGTGAHLQGPVTTIVKHPMRDIYSLSKLSCDFSSLHHFYTHNLQITSTQKNADLSRNRCWKIVFLRGVCAIQVFLEEKEKTE